MNGKQGADRAYWAGIVRCRLLAPFNGWCGYGRPHDSRSGDRRYGAQSGGEMEKGPLVSGPFLVTISSMTDSNN